MVTGVGVGASASGLVAGALDDIFGKFVRRCDSFAGGDEKEKSCGAFWTVFSGGVCDCVGVGELFAVVDKGGILGFDIAYLSY